MLLLLMIVVAIIGILFMLLGGAVADRADCRRLLVRGHLLVALPPLLLGTAIARGWLAYGGLVAYALAVGTIGAFVMPARDVMLTRVAEGGLGRAVAIMTATQFAAQLAGIAAGAAAGAVGAPALLFLQSAMLALGGVAALRLPAASRPLGPRSVVASPPCATGSAPRRARRFSLRCSARTSRWACSTWAPSS
jgi:MFS family permease